MVTRRISIRTTARTIGSSHIKIRTTVSNGSTTRTTTKTIRVK